MFLVKDPYPSNVWTVSVDVEVGRRGKGFSHKLPTKSPFSLSSKTTKNEKSKTGRGVIMLLFSIRLSILPYPLHVGLFAVPFLESALSAQGRYPSLCKWLEVRDTPLSVVTKLVFWHLSSRIEEIPGGKFTKARFTCCGWPQDSRSQRFGGDRISKGHLREWGLLKTPQHSLKRQQWRYIDCTSRE